MANGLHTPLRPSATTETNLYTCPAGKDAVVNIMITNTGTTIAKIRIALQLVSGAMAASEYILYDYPVYATDMPVQITGIALTALNNIRVYTDVATVNFSLQKLENTTS